MSNSNRAIREHIKKRSTSIRNIAEVGIWDGVTAGGAYFEACRHWDFATGTMLLYTRESGYHSGGWWKNPAYERCYHLSISFRDTLTLQPCGFNKKLARLWCEHIFRDMNRFTWYESPVSDKGKYLGVHHWRVFCDPAWKPIIPPKEVYSRDNTPSDYKTTSEISNLRASAQSAEGN